MSARDALLLDLRAAAEAARPTELLIDNDFFAELDADDLTGGNLNVRYFAEEKGEGAYKLRLEINGAVTTPCDRCLDDVSLSIGTTYECVVLPFGSPEADDDTPTAQPGGTFDASHALYEAIELALPLTRTHDEGACNAEMMKLLNEMSPDTADTGEA